MLVWLLSLLPPRIINRMVKTTDRMAAKVGILDDMRGIRSSGQPFTYVGNEMLHRDGAFASFEVADIWSNARWGVTFDAVRGGDPDWVDIPRSMEKLRDQLVATGNALFLARSFEKDGSVLIRDLEVQA